MFVWLDAFKLMSLQRNPGPAAAWRGRRDSPPGRSAAGCSTRCRSAFPATAASSRRGSRRRSRRVIMIVPVPLQPHRLQARRGHLRLRDRRRLLGGREIFYLMQLPRIRRRHLAGARARHRGDARHHPRHPRRHRARVRRARNSRGRRRLSISTCGGSCPAIWSRSRSTRPSTSSPTGRWWR